ncbi:MAG: hypothetical protein COB35_00865 [Gammaproteobacteria bacterium]|nr:MAG: hypothetical protein COB35_00865 [Gammaproteobacteria bacterium]
MKITNSTSFSTSVQALSNKTPANNQQAKIAAQEEKQTSAAKTVARLDVNEQAIALLDQQAVNKSGLKSENKSGKNSTFANAGLDQPSKQNLSAINTYQSVNNLTQRENIQSMLGVDLFA